MNIFAISDLHLSFGVEKPMDIFCGWDSYTERLKENWCKLVNEDDVVVIPGDISWGLKIEECKKDFEFLDSLPGKKIILKGNHDLWWSTVTKINNYFSENGFDSLKLLHNNSYKFGEYAICGTRGWFLDEKGGKKVINREVGRLKFSLESALKEGLKPIVFLHYPPAYSDYKCEEILEVLKEYKIKKVYYGHIHGKGSEFVLNECDGIKLKLISSDYLKFTPYFIEKI